MKTYLYYLDFACGHRAGLIFNQLKAAEELKELEKKSCPKCNQEREKNEKPV